MILTLNCNQLGVNYTIKNFFKIATLSLCWVNCAAWYEGSYTKLHIKVNGPDILLPEKNPRYQFYITPCVPHSRSPLWHSGQSSWLHNGDILCCLWGTNWIYICYVEERRPPLWSSGQSSWLQMQRFGFDSRRYQIFWEAVGLERCLLSLVSTIEELLERKRSGSGLERREYGRGDPSFWPRDTLYP
jgi:hypothetical protein